MAKSVRIGVISDTHLTSGAKIPKTVFDRFKGVDRIIHAGDLVCLDVKTVLESIAPVDAVRGNMDATSDSCRLPTKLFLDVAGCRIGVIHGAGASMGIADRVFQMFECDDVQVIIFGHSHQPFVEERDGVLLLNPGSATDKRSAANHTVAILTISDGKRNVELIVLD